MLRQYIQKLADELSRADIDNALREAEWMVEEVAGVSREDILFRTGQVLDDNIFSIVRQYVERRKSGEPLQYILGSVEFCGVCLKTGPGVLIPRPETEQLAMLALEHYPGSGSICDLCTGSGAVAIALSHNLSGENGITPDILGVDISAEALEYARDNIASTGAFNVRLLKSDLLDDIPNNSRFSLVCANPPYVSEEEYAELPQDVREHEPRQALEAGEEGLDCIRRLLPQAANVLEGDKGVILCEVGELHAESCVRLALDAGFVNAQIENDYAGRPRFLIACKTICA